MRRVIFLKLCMDSVQLQGTENCTGTTRVFNVHFESMTMLWDAQGESRHFSIMENAFRPLNSVRRWPSTHTGH